MLIPTVMIFALSVLVISLISYRLLDRTVQTKTNANLDVFTDLVLAQIGHLDIILNVTKQTLKEKHIAIAKFIEYILENVPEEDITTEELQRLARPLDIIELNVANKNGILTSSNVPTLIGFDYKAFESTKIYMALTTGALKEISEEPRRSVLDDNTYGEINQYTGIARKNGGFIQLGFNASIIGRLQDEINIGQTIKETKLGDNGHGLVLSAGIITAHPDEALLKKDVSNEDWYIAINSGNGFTWLDINGGKYYAGYKNIDGHTIVGLVPESDFYRESHNLLTAVKIITAAAIFVSCFIGLIFFYNRNEKLKALSITDELTKLNNRRSFLGYMDLIWKQNQRLKLPISILMLDVDYFKKYNDSLGHLEGDKTLIAIAQCLKKNVKRETDFVARFGGEEFVCLLPFVGRDEALDFAKTLVQRVESMKIIHPMSEVSDFVTISVGVASAVPNENDSQTKFLDEADKALYMAKKTGRNKAIAN